MLSSSDIIKTASFDKVLIPLVVRLLYLKRLGQALLLTNFDKIDFSVKLTPLLISWLTPVKSVPRSVFCVVAACTLLVAYQVFLLVWLQIIQWRVSLVLYNSFNTLWEHTYHF
jgi:hypothetical protein